MNLVVALPYSPYPVERGTGRLIMNLLEGLSQRHRVVLVTMTLSSSAADKLRTIERENLAVRSIVAPNRRSMAAKVAYRVRFSAARLLRSIPLETSYSAPKEFLSLIARTAEETDADLVLANYWHLHGLPAMLGGRPSALITHDIDFMVERSPDRGREKIERRAYREYSTILTVTERDADALRKEYSAKAERIHTLPLAIDLESFHPGTGSDPAILMTGTFTSDFNVDALEYMLFEVLPELSALSPSARLRVVGGGVPHDIIGRAPGNVEFAGYVEDIAAELARARIMVLPLRFAGGVRIRMMEAAASGLAVVSSPAGVEGMGLADGVDVMIADGPREFAAKIVDLMKDGRKASLLGERARLWAEENFSMADYPERLDRMLGLISRER